MSKLLRACCLLFCVSLFACTPKTSESTAKTPTTAPDADSTSATAASDETLSPCPKFRDAPNPGQVEDNYVIYRDYLRTGQTDKAYELWQTVYEVAPAADGRRNTVITDGIYFMEYYASQTSDTAKQAEYADRIFQFYDKIGECYPEGGYVPARKGFDYFYKYPDRATEAQQFALFEEAIKIDGDTVGDFILNPFASLLVQQYEAGAIDQATTREYQQFILDRIEKGKSVSDSPEERERWAIIEGYAPERLAAFETVEGFYECDYYKEKYLQQLADSPDDCALLAQTAGLLKYGGCAADDPDYVRLISAYKERCRAETTSAGGSAYAKLQDGDYEGAVAGFEEQYAKTDDEERKAQIALVLAKVYYGNLRQFSTARKWARQAAADKPGWGEPYILVGKLYASSGPICGPGTGFDSQIVVWPAIDQWNRAKSVDKSVAAEATELINRYAQYMPDKGELFSRTIPIGSKYTVPCWIGETTTVRAAP